MELQASTTRSTARLVFSLGKYCDDKKEEPILDLAASIEQQEGPGMLDRCAAVMRWKYSRQGVRG